MFSGGGNRIGKTEYFVTILCFDSKKKITAWISISKKGGQTIHGTPKKKKKLLIWHLKFPKA
jgi:hypothetical protein